MQPDAPPLEGLLSSDILNRIPAWELPPPGAAGRLDLSHPSYRVCREVTRHHARSFYFASHYLPRAQRHAAYAIYAFCRHIDDLIDEAATLGETPTAEQLEDQTRALFEQPALLPFGSAFVEVVQVYRIPEVLWRDLITGCCLDRQPVRLQNFSELAGYCYLVASVVGLMMCPIFGLRTASALPRAVEMGIAMQLTNIIRDVREDWERGRIYLPADELAAAGVTVDEALFAAPPDAAWQSFLQGQVARARAFYQSGSRGLPALANDGSRRTATTMARVYAGILGQVEKHRFDLSRRHYLSLPGKILYATGLKKAY